MFKDCKEAGNFLAKELTHYKKDHPVVLAIPRGGVEVGYQIAIYLNCDFDVVVSRKLGYLNNPETAFGALAEDGSLYLDSRSKLRLSKMEIENVIAKEEKEIERRVRIYRKNKPMISLENRTVILVDDGIATGSTLFASIELCKKQHPEKIVIAVPVCAPDFLNRLIPKVDDVIVLQVPERFHAVSQVYDEFMPLGDEKVLKILNKWQTRHKLINDLNQLM